MQENWKTMERESDDNTTCKLCCLYSHRWTDKGTIGLRNKSKNKDHPNYSIIKIGLNTKKSTRDLRLAVIKTRVRNHQQMFM